MHDYRQLSEIPLSVKVLDTLFLIAVGMGFLFAMAHTLYSHQGHDGRPGLSVEDVRIAYYGEHQQTRLGTMINGAMGVYLRDQRDKDRLVSWIERGADEVEYLADVKPILERNCQACHSGRSGMNIALLETFDQVKQLSMTDTGASIQSLVRVSHIHMFGIALILFLVGRIFVLCRIPVILKVGIVVVPFIAVMLDIISWYLTKWMPGFAVLVYLSGSLMGVSVLVQILLSIHQMWFSQPASASVAEFVAESD